MSTTAGERVQMRLPCGRSAPALAAGLALAGCAPAADETAVLLPAAQAEAIVGAARDCAAGLAEGRVNLPALRKRGWREADAGAQQEYFTAPIVVLVKSGEAPLMTLFESGDGARVCSLSSRLGEGTSFEQVQAAFDASFGRAKFADGFYYYYREPQMLALTRHPQAPDSQVQVAVMEPDERQLADAGVLP